MKKNVTNVLQHRLPYEYRKKIDFGIKKNDNKGKSKTVNKTSGLWLYFEPPGASQHERKTLQHPFKIGQLTVFAVYHSFHQACVRNVGLMGLVLSRDEATLKEGVSVHRSIRPYVMLGATCGRVFGLVFSTLVPLPPQPSRHRSS